VTYDQARAIANRLQAAISQRPVPLASGGPSIDVAVSGGLVYIPASEVPFSMEEALWSAEDALRTSKQSGGNRVTIAQGPGGEVY
jgi:GGDEF domain-containing protein